MKHSTRLRFIASTIVALAALLSATSASAAARTASVSGNWSSTATWGGSAVPVAGDTVTITNGVTVTVDTSDAVCTSLQICGATAGTATLTFAASGSPTLTVSGGVTVGNSAGSTRIGVITFTSGSSLICGSLTHGATGSQASSISMTAGGTLQVNGTITVSSSGSIWTPGAGTVILTATNTLPGTIFSSFNNLTVNGGATTLNINLSILGNLTVNAGVLDLATATANRSSAGGTLTVADAATLVLGGAVNFPNNFSTVSLGSSSTVIYDNAGAQTVNPRAFGNLVFAGSGAKSITNASTSVSGNLSIAPTGSASATINAGLTINVGSLTLGGLGRINGTWGGNTSGATYTNTTYFAATTGKLSVTSDTRTAPTVTTWPTASAITYGQALSSSTLSGGSAPAGSFAFIDPSFIPTTTGVYAAPVRFTATDITSYNSSVTNNVNVAVGTKVLTVTGTVAADKVYDRTFTTTVDVSGASLVGVVSPDVVTLGGTAAGTFASSNVANNITVTISGLTLGGADAGKYTLIQPTDTANITAKPVTVASGLAVVNRLYNGLTSATITSNNVTLAGVVSGDTITARTNSYVATFADKHAGTGKTVTVTGMTLSGTPAANYSLTAPSLLANLLATNITVTARTNFKVYDGSTAATNTPTITAGNLQTGDALNFTEAYSSPLVGTGNRVLVPAGVVNDGNGGANYSVTFANFTTGTIAAKTLTVTGVTAANKVYDRAFTATVDTNAAVLVGVVSPDVVNLGGNPTGLFVSSNVANSITVNIAGLTITGADAGNYSLTQPTATADITTKPVTITSGLTGVSRLYNGLTSATIASNNVVLAGIVAGDTINARTNGYTASFADKHVGTGKTVTVSGLTLSGTSSNNYALTQPTFIANILATNITVTARTNYKNYDATTTTTNTPTVTGTIQTGDSASWSQVYATPNAGTNNKVIIPSGSVTDGNSGANYSITFSNYVTGTIASKALTVTGITASDKVYDRTFAATIDTNAAVLVGVIVPEDVTFDGAATGTFVSSNVANNITVNIAGLTLGGADVANYRLTQPTTTANITAKTVTISSGLAGVTRGYNGTTTATISSNNVVLSGLIAGDTVNARTNGYTAFFADRNVGTSKPLIVSGINLNGTPAANYSLVQPTNLTANITNRSLIVTAVGVNKVYDGTTTATVTLTNDAVSGDVVTQNYTTATFVDKNIGTNKTVSVSGISITGGADAGNYALSNTTETTTANITVLPVQLTGAHIYDATSNAPAADLNVANNHDAANLTLSGNVTLAGKNVGSQAITSIGAPLRVQSTTGSANAATTISMTALGSTPINGNTLVAIISTRGTALNQVSSITQTGVTWTRVVQSGAGTNTTSTTEIWYAPNISGAGTAITINLAASLRASAVVMEYSGLLKPTSLDATNSSFSSGTAGVTASSGTTATTAQANEVCVAGLSLVNSSYTLSSINNSFNTIADVPSTSGTSGNNTELYALEKMVTTTGPVSVSGTISTSSQWSGAVATFRAAQATAPLVLTGSFATNYTLTGFSGAVDINPKALTATGLAASNKIYDGNTTAALTGSATLLATEAAGAGNTADGRPYIGDTVSVTGPASGAFADKIVGLGKPVTVTGLTLSGAQASNYSITQPTGLTANITALGLTGIITAGNKTYDGNTSATIISRSLTGVIGLDDVALAGGTATFNTKNVGGGKAVTASGFNLTGADAANYSAPASASTTADITVRSLTVSAAAQNRAYNGNTTATVLFSDDRLSGDVLTASASSANFDTKHVGTAKPVSVLGIGISGLDAGNYALANTTAGSSADITPASLTGHITADNKIYDGNNSATIAARTLTGVFGVEDVSLSGGTATFNNKNVGTSKTVTATGLSLSGADIANYTLASSGATTTANITALVLTGSVTMTNKIYDGTTNAVIVARAVTGVLGGEDVSLTGGVASYDDKNIGTNKNVTITGLALSGADVANYSFASNTLTGAADITERALNISALGVNKTYDATTTATVTLSDDRIVGDVLTTAYAGATFADALVGAAKPVTVSGVSVSGVDAANYLLANTETNTVADITGVLLTPSITAANKIYDGNNSATIASRSLTGVIGLDDVSLVGGAASFANKNAGVGKSVAATGLSLGGADAGNYQLAATIANTTADIAPASLTASATANNKVYNGTTAATIASRSLTGVIAPDDVTLSGGSASFVDKNAGNGKTVSVLGMILGGADLLNYTLVSGDANTTADITTRSLTVGAAASSKVYNGNADATVVLSDNRISGDVLTVNHTAALFDNKNVGIAKPVTISGISTTGADAGNYNLANIAASSSADIAAASLTVGATADNKVYDGTTAATIATRSLTGVIAPDDVTISGGTASFADKNVGNGKTVAVAGMVLGGADMSNYTLASGDANTAADITARALSVMAAASNKVYDGNANATVSLSDDRISGDVLTVSHTTAAFDNKNVGIAKPVTVAGISKTGADAGNYNLANTTASGSADITVASLTASATAANKVYDATTGATIASRSLAGVIAPDDVMISGGTASFANKNVGVSKTVSVTGMILGGADLANYTLASGDANTTADITAASLAASATVANKVYDGTTAATIATRMLTGVIAPDDVTLSGGSASFADKNVGSGKTVTVIGMVLGGADLANYSLTSGDANTTADITARSLSVTAAAGNKVYDGNANATVTLSDDRISGDVLTISHTTASFDNKNVGTAKLVSVSGISMTGAGAGNYSLANTTASSNADITAASLTGSITANSKVYDGNTSATIATRSLAGVIAPDDVTLSGGSASFTDKIVGNSKTVSVTGIALGGADMANYTLASGDVNTTADITERALTITATGVNKIYDATNTAMVTLSDDRISGDVFTASYTNAEFASINVGTGIAVNVSGLAIAGTDATNYMLLADTVATNADITARPLLVTATAQNKVYDGNAAATVTLSDDHIAGEDVAVSFTTASFDDKNAGIAKPVTVSGLSISGAGVGNYELAATTANTTAEITTASLTASATAASKVYDGTTTATIASRTLTGVIAPDDVTLSGGTAGFGNKNVGIGKTVSVIGMVLGGADLANYTLASGDANTSADILVRPLVVAALAQNKVYDGNANATVSLSDNRILGDVLTVGHAAAAFDNKNVGTAKTITVSGINMTGADAVNYSLANGSATSSADITGRSLTVAALAQNKVYDGNADATVTLSDDRIGGDVLTVNHTFASFDNKNVGSAKLVSVSGISTTGVDAGNYNLANTTASSSADITAASLAASATVANKVYDGTTAATIATRTLTGVIAPDDVTISGGTASFGDKNVGIGKAVAVSGMVLGGADMANYTLASGDASTTADITAASLAASATANSKVYDGTTAATIATRSLTGVIAPDDVTISGGTASFGDKNVGSGKTVTVIGMVLGGADLANYTLASGDANTTADITVRSLSVTAAASNKVYDGNVAATVTLSDDRIGGDVLTVSHTVASFDDKNIGTAKLVSVSGIGKTGTDAGNYSLANTSASSSADITARSLTVSAVAQNKVYDANVDASVTLSDDRISGDVLTVSHTAASFDNKNVGTAKIVSVSGISMTGAGAGNYSLANTTASSSADVTARSLTITATAQNKVYDGNTNTVVSLADNRISGDVLTAANTDAGFEDANVGAAKTVNVLGLSISGTDAANYSLASLSTTATADITAVQLTVTADNKSRAYGAANPALTATISGFVNSEDNSVIFGSAELTTLADTNSLTGGYPITAALGTLSATNYTFSFVDGTLTITPYALIVTADNQARIYGAANPTLTGSLIGLQNGDDIIASYATSADASSPVGVYPITAALADPNGKLVNYSVTTNEGTLTINAATLLVTADNQTRVYGAANPTLTAAISGFVNGENNSVITGSAAVSTLADESSAVGSHPITAALGTLSAANYAFSFADGSLEITAASLMPSITVNSKVYDGNNSAVIATRSLTGVVGVDDVSLSGGSASFADKNAGIGKTVIATGLSLSGAAAGNYTLATTSANTLADITPASLSASATANSKVYDSTTAATIASRSLTGVIAPDDVTISGGTASFVNKNVGIGKAVSVTGMVLGGADLANYTLASGDANTTADITAASLAVSATANSKVYDGTTAATIATRSLTGVIAPDDVTISDGVASFTDKNVGIGKNVSVTGMILGGADMANYTLASGDANTTADITARSLIVTAAAGNKVYDGNANATVTLSDDRISGDVLTISHTTASFDNKNVGTAKLVSVSGISMTGAGAGNYSLANTTASSNADITVASLTGSITANSKVYDGNTSATIASRSIAGVIGLDDVSLVGGTAVFADKNVGNGKTVSATGLGLSGADAVNYNLASTSASTMANITAASLTANAIVSNKVYDGNTSATITTRSLTGVIAPDDVTLSGGTASFADKNVGNGKAVSVTGVILGGADLANYTLASGDANTTADITAATLTGNITAANKAYDGNVNATIASRSLTGVIGLDDVSLTGGTATFNNKNVGSGKPVTASGLSLSGADVANYSLASSSASTTADITAIALTVTADDQSRNYGEANPTLTGTLTGMIAGDNITVSYSTTATIASPAGTYDITPALNDPDSNLGNYVVTINNGTLTVLSLTPSTIGSIEQRTDGNMHIVVNGTPDQVYHLQAVGDLSGSIWSNISTNTANGLGVVEFDDLSATNHTSRFYRISTP